MSGDADILEVIDGGLLTTVQDEGRPGLGSMGVSQGGACDPWSLAAANVACGNAPGAAALEATLIAPTLLVLRRTAVALAGADLGIRVRSQGGERPFGPGAARVLEPGDQLVGGESPAASGARAYLAVAGGLAVPRILGSASTDLRAGFGGYDGRALRTGDRLAANGTPSRPLIPVDPLASGLPADEPDRPILILPGPWPERLGDGVLDRFLATPWRVAASSDRMGVRLDGPPLAARTGPDVASHGVTWGTIQLPPDGLPIVLLADHQPTGGYPVLAVAAVAERPRLGQVRPGSVVRFALTTPDRAVDALRLQQAALRDLVRTAAEVRGWDELAGSAGG